jgi:hypothetical protein
VNADQKIALWSILSGASVGLGGLAVALFSGWRDRAGALSLAREERQQQRRADAYVAVLAMAEKAGYWVATVRPLVETEGYEPLPLPDLDSQSRASALINAFGSTEVHEAYEAWREIVQSVLKADRLLGLALDSRQRGHGDSGIDVGEEGLKLHVELRPAEVDARTRMVGLIAAELATDPEARK